MACITPSTASWSWSFGFFFAQRMNVSAASESVAAVGGQVIIRERSPSLTAVSYWIADDTYPRQKVTILTWSGSLSLHVHA